MGREGGRGSPKMPSPPRHPGAAHAMCPLHRVRDTALGAGRARAHSRTACAPRTATLVIAREPTCPAVLAVCDRPRSRRLVRCSTIVWRSRPRRQRAASAWSGARLAGASGGRFSVLGGAGCSHVRRARADACACPASMRCPLMSLVGTLAAMPHAPLSASQAQWYPIPGTERRARLFPSTCTLTSACGFYFRGRSWVREGPVG